MILTSEQYELDGVEDWAFQGNSFWRKYTLTDANGAPIDLTSATIKFTLGTLNEASSGATVGAGNSSGEVEITITYTAMEALAVGNYDYALETLISGIRTTRFTGTFTVKEDMRV